MTDKTSEQKISQISQVRKAIADKLSAERNYLKMRDESVSEGDYTLNDLLATENTEEFVERAYEILLGRPADLLCVRNALHILLEDNIPRIEWLKTIRDSDEGRRSSASERWLNIEPDVEPDVEPHVEPDVELGFQSKEHTIRHRLKTLPFIGRFLVLLWRWLTAGRSVNEINHQISQLTEQTNQTTEQINQIEHLRLDRNNEIEHQLQLLRNKVEDANRRALDALEYTYARQYGLSIGNKPTPGTYADKPNNKASELSSEYIWDFFLKHSQKFRGSEANISHLCEVYLPFFSTLLGGRKEKQIIDIGCGRGEMLQMIADAGLNGIGVDANRLAVDYCTKKKLTAFNQDVLEYLKSQKSNSIGAITAIHIIEHLDFNYLMALLKEAFRALSVGGGIIVEAPNPENLVVSSLWFYLDPTHKNPVPPALMQLMMEHSGFSVERIDLGPRDNADYKKRSEDGQLNHLLNSPQDYSLLGTKLE